MVKGVIFDLDGVLLDSISHWMSLGENYVKFLGFDAVPNIREILFSMSMEQGAQWLRDTYHLNKSPECIKQEMEDFLQDAYFNEILLKPGAYDLLTELHHRQIHFVAATSSPRKHVTKALERNGVLDMFDAVFTNGEIGESKHSPLIYQISAERLKAAPQDLFVFEDSLYALKTAKNAGFHTVGIYDEAGECNQTELEDEAQYYFESPLSFLSSLREGNISEFMS